MQKVVADGTHIASNILKDLEKMLLAHGVEIANFTKELRERFDTSVSRTTQSSETIINLIEKIMEEKNLIQSHTSGAHEAHVLSLADFQKSYEEQSRREEQKLLADINALVSGHVRRQKELVDVRLNGFGEAAKENKMIIEKHTNKIEGVTNEAKRKWEEFTQQAEFDLRDGSNFSAAKHCRLESLLDQCVKTAGSASEEIKKTKESVTELSAKQVSGLEELVRNAIVCNEHHDAEVAHARSFANEDISDSTMEIINQIQCLKETDEKSMSALMSSVGAHTETIIELENNHQAQTNSISIQTDETFNDSYKDYEATGETPVRCEPEIPTKMNIESLRAMPMEKLVDEFRDNHPYESSKDPKPTMIPRSPLIQLNRHK